MSIITEIQRLKQAKNDLFSAITAKGGELSANQSISDYASAVMNLKNSSSISGDIEFGYLKENGIIQLYDFSVTPPQSKGTGISAPLATILPEPYTGHVADGEYLRFTAIEDSTVSVYGTANICFDLVCRKNSGYWVRTPVNAIQLEAGEYVEFYGNYGGTAFLDIDLDEVETDDSNTINYKPFLGFETAGRLRCSGYLNAVSAFSNTLATGTYFALMAGCEGVISTPIIPKMTAVYNGKTDEFPFELLVVGSTVSEITAEFTDWNGAESVKWLQVAPNGTFRKPASLPAVHGTTSEGKSTFIPPEWTIENI